ncbi:MAG: glycoside hydrolase family 3 C-terminal domain-containing protein [Bacteroidales bacterium]|nr:glycoside hydrolase family 3 C-terminal domain-containing protein [Bacteroidales bacterium]
MKKNIFCFIFLSLAVFSSAVGTKQEVYPYRNAGLPVGKRVADLIARMTNDEKIRQLDMYWGKEVANMGGHEASSYSEEKIKKMMGTAGMGSIHDFYPSNAAIANQIQKYAIEKTRLGIPVLFIEEGLHGYEGFGSTTFPIPLQLAAAWDTAIVRKIGRVIATESRAHGVDMILGPVLCLPRDARWGRVEETYGEDPYLAAVNGVAMVKGLQGSSLKSANSVIAEPKHFAVHGIPEAGSNISPVSIGEREARSSFLYVFEKAVKEGGAMGIMAAYHEMDGIPCVDNDWLLTNVLRKEWGFKGFVLSDLAAIRMTLESHKVAKDTSDALAQTFKAGMSMQFYDFEHDVFHRAMQKAIKNKSLSENDLNRAVGDVLKVKFLLGLFDQPYTDTSLLPKVFHQAGHQDLALKAAQEGICLLKNEKNLLPVQKNVQSIAVIGPLATSTYLGGYSNKEGKGISILDGLKQRAGKTLQVHYAAGYSSDSGAVNEVPQKEAVNLVKNSDLAIVVLGEDPKMVGEGKDRANLNLDENQMTLIKALHQTGKPIVVVLFNGRPLTINWVAENIPSILETWFSGEKGGLAIADILLGKVNPSGKLPITFPRSIGQIPYYYNHKPTSKHKYVDEEKTPLFPFGHGLSYTSFEYSGLKVSPVRMPVSGKATISVQVKNTGKTEGTEVVQLYIRDEIGSVTTPVLALKGFNRISLKPGETGTVTFRIGAEELSLWNRQMKRVVEPGEFKVMIGSSSDDIRQNGSLWVTEK